MKTLPVDLAKYYGDPAEQADLLADAFETGDAGYIANALGIIARARGMTKIAEEAGITREALYKSLSPKGDPRLSTLIGVAKALGVTITTRSLTPRATKKTASKRAKRKAA